MLPVLTPNLIAAINAQAARLEVELRRVDQTTGVIQAGPNYLQDAVNLNALLA